MFRLLAGLAALTLLLTGCVLQADPPLFGESQGVLALGTSPVAFDGWTLKNGSWTKSDDDQTMLRFTPAGHHYVVAEEGPKADKKKNAAMALLVPLKGNWLAMQFSEPDKPAIYALAKLDGRKLLVTPMMCDDLKKQADLTHFITFERYDCTLKATDPVRFLSDVAARLPPPELMLVPVH